MQSIIHNMDSQTLKNIEQEVAGLSQAEVLDLAARLIEIAKAKTHRQPLDLSQYSGILDPRLDPLEYQHAMRDEWER